jgi:hypothetical protein
MRKKGNFAASVAAAMMLAGQLWAGDVISLQLGNAEARKANAVATIKATGCGSPENAKVTATAIGTVNGRRQSIPLKLIRLSEPGVFALPQQWPQDGKWVIELVGRNGGLFTNTLVRVGPGGLDRHNARSGSQPFTAADVQAMLDTR